MQSEVALSCKIENEMKKSHALHIFCLIYEKKKQIDVFS